MISRACLVAVAAVLALAPGPGWGAATAPARLPPAAQAALERGVAAATASSYPEAIRLFQEARRAASDAPVIYLNLGLAEGRIPGRELRAAAWLGAYEAAYPSAPNLAAVKRRVAELQAVNRANLAVLVASLVDANAGSASSMELRSVAIIQAEFGDIPGAQKTVARIPDAFNSCPAYGAVYWAQLKVLDFAGARRSGALMPDGCNYKTGIEDSIGKVQTGRNVILHSTADWLRLLDDTDTVNPCALNTGPFLDLAAYSASGKSSYQFLRTTIGLLVTSQNCVEWMLSRQ